MKICTVCKENKHLDCFNRNKNNRDGLECRCKPCRRIYRQQNKEEINKKQFFYREKNKELYKNYWQEYCIKNKEKKSKYIKEYQKNNRGSINNTNSKRRAVKLRATPTMKLKKFNGYQMKNYILTT